MDEITNKVKAMYERYPFPGCNLINVAYGNRIKNDLKNRGMDVFNLKILEAGCGSGEKAVSLAKVFSNCEVTGWDISSISIEKARLLAESEGVKNIRFESVDLVNINLDKHKGYFDIIISWGVIHHLSNPVKGLSNLGQCLKPKGLLYVWVYALLSFQRTETRLFREAISLLLEKEGFSYEKGIPIAQAIKGLLKTVNYSRFKDMLMRLKWFFDKNVDKKDIILQILKKPSKVKCTSDYDINMVDAFLHANVEDYDVKRIFAEAKNADLEILDFLDLPQKIEDFVKSDYVINLYYKLDFFNRLLVMERLINPGNHLFLARRKK